MSRLIDLIDDYKDRHGQPSDASIARAIGVTAQTVSSWRNRGLKELPDRETLRQLAAFIRQPVRVVIDAALVDARFLRPDEAMPPVPPQPPADPPGRPEEGRRGA